MVFIVFWVLGIIFNRFLVSVLVWYFLLLLLLNIIREGVMLFIFIWGVKICVNDSVRLCSVVLLVEYVMWFWLLVFCMKLVMWMMFVRLLFWINKFLSVRFNWYGVLVCIIIIFCMSLLVLWFGVFGV